MNDSSIFLGRIFSFDKTISLQTTVDLNLTVSNTWTEIQSDDFDIRYTGEHSSRFLIVLYERMLKQVDENRVLTRSNGVMKTTDRAFYQIDIDTMRFDVLDVIIVQGDLNMIIRLFEGSESNERIRKK